VLVVNLALYGFLRRHSVPSTEATRLAEQDPDWDEDTRLDAIARAWVRTIPPGLSGAEIDALLAELRRQLEARNDNENNPRKDQP
jgi:hypothetical protein